VEYLVTMTTHVPDGTSDAAVEDVRGREDAHSMELAADGHLLRLWRPPLQPGEWRTLGLFAAADRTQLESVLVSMPLRIWRSDEVATLSPHPNDPGAGAAGAIPHPAGGSSEFLTTCTITVPPGTPSSVVDANDASEATCAKELAGRGSLQRLWTLAGADRALGLWRASDAPAMEAILDSLPLGEWSAVETVRLDPHPSDPGSGPR
jgi:muconolactone delta-isomerase